MFWGAVGLGFKGPCHVFDWEKPEELVQSCKEIAEINSIVQAKRLLVWQQSTPKTHPERFYKNGNQRPMRKSALERSKKYCGGVNWWLYFKQILLPLVLPWAARMKQEKPGYTFMHDKAPGHNQWFNNETFVDHHIKLLDWPGM